MRGGILRLARGVWHTVRVDVPKVFYVDIEGTFVVGGTRSRVRGIFKYRSQQKTCFGVLCNFIVTPRFIIALETKEQKRRSRVGRTDGRPDVFLLLSFFFFPDTTNARGVCRRRRS